MFELNIQFIITYMVVAGVGFFVTTSAYCGGSLYNLCPSGDAFQYPFFGGSYRGHSSDICGYPGFEINCNPDNGRPMMNVSNHLYYVLSVDTGFTRRLTLVDVEVEEEECPRPTHNFTLQTSSLFQKLYSYSVSYFYNCSNSSSGYSENAVQHLPCLDTDNTTPGLRSFALLEDDYPQGDGFNWWYQNCQENVVVPVTSRNNYSDYRQTLKSGFTLDWYAPEECYDCERSGGSCLYNQTEGAPPLCYCNSGTKLYRGRCPSKGVCSGVGGLLLVMLFIFRRKLSSLHSSTVSHWKSKIKNPTNVEAFLESCGCPGLQRYRYSEIKRMTNTFKEKLGQGGFGSVFKGKLSDGRLVAVKVLNESKGNGEYFINEVATIGGTNHVNVVSLLGFCSNGNKRALVYEFMPNGSLEKFIYNRENTSIANPPLGPEKLYQIALGIARGLEYLHRGCKIRILHFDIKPHNILLDQDFCPKIADFGLAKLCQTRESIVSMHAARGTMGYIAPEVTCINFGGVSHKSDVYSYGMMILEMIGGRKNIDTTVENISEIYFPQWMYNHFIHDTDDIDGHNEIFKEENIKKMIVAALHCIQTQPANRPSISKVVKMLEGNVDELQMPPNPFQDPPRLSP